MSVGREAWAHLGGRSGKCFQNTLYEKNAFSKELKKSNIERTCRFKDSLIK